MNNYLGSALPPTLNTFELAGLLKLSVTTVRTYVSAKEYQHLLPRPLPRTGAGSTRNLWLTGDVLAWLAAGRPPTAPQPPARRRGRPSKREQAQAQAGHRMAARAGGVND